MSSHQPNFDRVAGIYRWAEYLALGPILQQVRIHFIPRLGHRRCALVFGDGDGRFLAALLAANSTLRATAVDSSARMLSLLQVRCSFAGSRLVTLHTSALDLQPLLETDLVVTHFFLDCLEQKDVEALAQRVAASCSPGALWLVSDFQEPEAPLLRTCARAYIRLLYLAFKFLTGLRVQQLPDTRSALQHAGFQRISYHQRLAGMIYTELWQLSVGGKMISGAIRNPPSGN